MRRSYIFSFGNANGRISFSILFARKTEACVFGMRKHPPVFPLVSDKNGYFPRIVWLYYTANAADSQTFVCNSGKKK